MRISIKRQKISKIQNRIYRAQNYNNWTEKLNKGIQQQTRSSERKEQWIQRQCNGVYPVRESMKLWD